MAEALRITSQRSKYIVDGFGYLRWLRCVKCNETPETCGNFADGICYFRYIKGRTRLLLCDMTTKKAEVILRE